MTLGDKRMLSHSQRNDYADAGAAHILALSGLHLSIIIAILSVLLAGFTVRLRGLLELIFVWAFALVSGIPVSVLRVSVMFTCFILAQTFLRRLETKNCLSMAAMIILFFAPESLFDIGFQLSFTAIFAIVMLHSHLYRLPLRMTQRIDFPAAVTRIPLLLPLYSILYTTLAAQIGTTPLTLFYFGRFPTYFLLSNSFVGLFATLTLLLAFLSMLLFGIGRLPILSALALIPQLHGWLVSGLDWIISLQSRLMQTINLLPHATITVNHLTIPQLLLSNILIILLVLPLFWKNEDKMRVG